MTRYVVAVMLFWVGVAVADEPPAPPTILSGRITDVLGKPIGDARIYVMPRAGGREETKTDGQGRYAIQLPGDGAHGVVIAVDKVHTFRQVLVARGATTTLDVEVEIDTAGGEVIKIIDRKLPPPKVQPKPINDQRMAPPYSDEAVERDAWARAWLLLDVDAQGVVQRIKLLKRPGFDLDQIAIDEAFKLRFEPARDADGKPVRTYLVWTMEWPSMGYIIQSGGVVGRLPNEHDDLKQFGANYRGDLTGRPWARPEVIVFPKDLGSVPCAGSGPLNLDLRNRAYRDCSQPDMSMADALPWITRETAPTALASLGAAYHPPDITARGSRVPAIISTSVTGVLAIGMITSWAMVRDYSGKVTGSWKDTQEERDRNEAGLERWQKRALIFSGAVVVSGAVTAFLWSRNQSYSSFSVQPQSGGAAVSFGKSF